METRLIVSKLIPLLNDIEIPVCLANNIIKVLALFGTVVDKYTVWFNLFVLDPQFMANYYHSLWVFGD